MASKKQGYELLPEELIGQVRALIEIADHTNGLVSSAQRLGEHNPLLGSSPPAMHLALRLRDAAGPSGLTGEVSAADTELGSYHRALQATVNRYQEGDDEVAWQLSDGNPTT